MVKKSGADYPFALQLLLILSMSNHCNASKTVNYRGLQWPINESISEGFFFSLPCFYSISSCISVHYWWPPVASELNYKKIFSIDLPEYLLQAEFKTNIAMFGNLPIPSILSAWAFAKWWVIVNQAITTEIPGKAVFRFCRVLLRALDIKEKSSSFLLYY